MRKIVRIHSQMMLQIRLISCESDSDNEYINRDHVTPMDRLHKATDSVRRFTYKRSRNVGI